MPLLEKGVPLLEYRQLNTEINPGTLSPLPTRAVGIACLVSDDSQTAWEDESVLDDLDWRIRMISRALRQLQEWEDALFIRNLVCEMAVNTHKG